MTVKTRAEVLPAIERASSIDGPVLIDFQIEQEHNVFPIVPVGRPIHEMIRRPRPDEQPR